MITSKNCKKHRYLAIDNKHICVYCGKIKNKYEPIMKKITSKNCSEWARQYGIDNNEGGIRSAWATVYTWCLEHKMKNIEGNTGLENVIKFLEDETRRNTIRKRINAK